jgi:CRISPR-associated protein Csm1
MEEKIIQLAALLHDIGKFWQRTSKLGLHQELSAEFIKTYVPKEEWRPSLDEQQQEVIVAADWLSSGEKEKLEEKGEAEKRKSTPLTSIFSKINIEKGEPPPEHYYPIKPLALDMDEDILFPKEGGEKGDLTEDYEDLWTGFEKEIKKIGTISDFNAYFNTLYYLLQKYTWCIPSAVGKAKPDDVSLFDHLKTTCAIASCLFKTKSEDKFLLIKGDISGIQDFIYKLASPEEAFKGMSKRLRGRSFYLTLLNETFAYYLLKELKLPITNLLWCGGGHFYILAPNIDDANRKLEEANERINKWLLNNFQGDLYLAIGKVTGTERELVDFAKLLDEVEYEVSKLKNQKFLDLMMKNRFKEKFELKKEVCRVCGKDIEKFADINEKTCQDCKAQKELGGKLPKVDYLVKIETIDIRALEDLVKPPLAFSDFNLAWSLRRHSEIKPLIQNLEKLSKEGKEKIRHCTIYKLNDTDFLDDDLITMGVKSGLSISFGFEFIGNVVPSDKEGVFDFAQIAELSEGSKRIGVLRMDVDDLGLIFSVGLGDDRTISRVSTLSRMQDIFFLGYMNRICEHYQTEKGIPKLYITYSGGDDLFIVGPWDTVIDASQEIYNEFKRYTCENPNITLSGSIFICKPKFPVGRFSKIAGEKLDTVAKKYHWEEGLKGFRKDAISVFEEVVHWREDGSGVINPNNEYKARFDECIEFGNQLREKVKTGGISKSFLYAMLHLKDDKLWRPKCVYLLTRDVKEEIQKELNLTHKYPKLREKIQIPVAWVSLKTR